jgi:hypothetical protein
MKTTKNPRIKVEINLVSGELTPVAQQAWTEFWQKTIEITTKRQPPAAN